MTNTEIIYQALLSSGIEIPELELEEADGRCIACGKEITEGAKLKKVISSNFTDYDTFKCPEGTHICKECGVCIKTRELRINNFIADKNKLYLFKKSELEEYLFNLKKYVQGDFVIGLTRSFKKHNSFRCTVNSSFRHFYIREEDKEYLFNTALAKELYEKLWRMYLYFTKDELITGFYSVNKIHEFGPDEFDTYENIMKRYRGTHYFDLLIYMLDSEKRNEIVAERIKQQKEEKQRQAKAEKERKQDTQLKFD